MQDIREPLIAVAIGAIVGAIVFVAGLLVVKELAEVILRINPWHAGVVGAAVGALALLLLWLWDIQRPRRR